MLRYCLVFTGVVVYDYDLRIGWGKAVSLPASALPPPPPGQMAVRPKELRTVDSGSSSASVVWSDQAAGGPQGENSSISGQNSEVVSAP